MRSATAGSVMPGIALGRDERSLVETAISRIKKINDGGLTSRTFGAQQNEVAIHIAIANRKMLIARPLSERIS